jgi:hypothetical protein
MTLDQFLQVFSLCATAISGLLLMLAERKGW